MATEEKSRDAFDPTKRYAAVGMQLGRVLVDDDFNEAERIRLEEERRVNLDVIGPVGSPDAGFLVTNGHLTGGRVDFDIGAGTLYLGGLRLWNPATATFALQGDWLQQAPADRPSLVVGRTDLVYVEAWQQPVTAVEDSELFEVALGGPDTSTRLRTMWRVRVAPGVTAADCPDAWAALTADWAAAGLGTVDATGERKVDTELTVTYGGGTSGDLCSPAILGGYLGAENQTLRVQLVDSTHLTWGTDNGGVVYRATLAADRVTLTLTTDPRDQAHWPTAGQIVEVLPWTALLTNGEKLADEVGHLARVATSYNPSTRELVLAAANQVPIGFGTAHTGRADAASLGTLYFYVRVWNRGDDHTSAPAIPFTVGTPVPLGTTGLRVTIDGANRVRGDHWIIAARPKTPDQVVPWALEAGRGVHGLRRWFAPLGLVRWKAGGAFDLLHDCRPHFLPLTRLRGCCTHTVGDEVSSFGQFKKIQDAIDALPAAGGKVCVLPGVYDETVVLIGRPNVTIEGCGARTRWRPAANLPWTLLAIGGRDLTVRDLAIEAGEAFGIVLLDALKAGTTGPTSLADAAWTGFNERLTRIRLERLRIEVLGRCAIAAVGGLDLVIRGCEILAGPLAAPMRAGSDLGRWPSILSFADDVLIEDNRILARIEDRTAEGATTADGVVTYTRTALGGIQLGSGTERATVRRNHIEGGNGDGVTLGSWAWVPRELRDTEPGFERLADAWRWNAGISITINAEGCIEIDWDPPPPDDGEVEWVPISMGPVIDIEIHDNKIRTMGRAGVGVARFFDLEAVDEIIAVRGLHVRGNRIEECLRLPVPEVQPASMREHSAAGVITLAEVSDLHVEHNDLVRCGQRHLQPVCGVFALSSQGAVVEHNRIVDNAPRDNRTEQQARPGWRGGVVLLHARPPAVTVMLDLGPFAGDQEVVRQDGQPAARVTDNVIVVPEGRPVLIVGQGPIVVADNHLTTRGVGTADFSQILAGGEAALAQLLQTNTMSTLIDMLGGVAAFVVDLGLSNELLFQLVFYTALRDQDLRPGPGLDPRAPIAASGNLTFAGNQVNVDLFAGPINQVLSAVTLLTLDDVGVQGNVVEVDRLFDPIAFTVLAMGMSARVQGNRVKESFGFTSSEGASIWSIGAMLNDTTHNQTTRCVVANGLRVEETPNQVFYEIFNQQLCGRVKSTGGVAFEERMVSARTRANPLVGPSTHSDPTHAVAVGPGIMDPNRRDRR